MNVALVIIKVCPGEGAASIMWIRQCKRGAVLIRNRSLPGPVTLDNEKILRGERYSLNVHGIRYTLEEEHEIKCRSSEEI